MPVCGEPMLSESPVRKPALMVTVAAERLTAAGRSGDVAYAGAGGHHGRKAHR